MSPWITCTVHAQWGDRDILFLRAFPKKCPRNANNHTVFWVSFMDYVVGWHFCKIHHCDMWKFVQNIFICRGYLGLFRWWLWLCCCDQFWYVPANCISATFKSVPLCNSSRISFLECGLLRKQVFPRHCRSKWWRASMSHPIIICGKSHTKASNLNFAPARSKVTSQRP